MSRRFTVLCLAICVLVACRDSVNRLVEVNEADVYGAAFSAVMVDALTQDIEYANRPYCLAILNDASDPRFHALSEESLSPIDVRGARVLNLPACRIEFSEMSTVQRVVTLDGERANLLYASHLSGRSGTQYWVDLAIVSGPLAALGYECKVRKTSRGWEAVQIRVVWRA